MPKTKLSNNKPDPSDEPVSQLQRAFLISGTYRCGTGSVIPSRDMSHAVTEFLDTCDVDPGMIMSYTQSYFIRPETVALKDVWLATGDEERANLARAFPEIATAISVLVGGDEG